MRKLLVTGAAGFIGVNFTKYWLNKYPNDFVVAFDALTYAGNIESLADIGEEYAFEFVQGNISDSGAVNRIICEYDIDTIVNFAAESHVDRSIVNPGSFIHTNIIGTYTLLEAVRRFAEEGRQIHFHHVSTDEVFGSLDENAPAFCESTPYMPNSPYAASKASSDHLVRAYNKTYQLKTTVSNCSNNYGPFQFPEKLIPLTLINLLTGKKIPVYGDGMNIRDWLYVDDHCRAIDLILEKGVIGETYNVGGGAEVKNIQLVNELCSIADEAFSLNDSLLERFPNSPVAHGDTFQSLITYVFDRPGHDRRYAIDSTKMSEELGYQPSVSLQEGLKRVLEWYINNTSWWQRILSGEYTKTASDAHWLST